MKKLFGNFYKCVLPTKTFGRTGYKYAYIIDGRIMGEILNKQETLNK